MKQLKIYVSDNMASKHSKQKLKETDEKIVKMIVMVTNVNTILSVADREVDRK